MELTPEQKQQFVSDGYTVVRGVVPSIMVEAARHAINHHLGECGMPPEELPKMRATSYCREITSSPTLTGLFNQTPAKALCESGIGDGKVLPATGAQIALRFPRPPGTPQQPFRGHLDGIGTDINGSQKGTYHRGFTALAVFYLCDVLEPWRGNFTVWPGSHRTFEDHFKEHGTDVLCDGMPNLDLPREPIQLTGAAGDLVLAHHQIVHTAAPNLSPDIRYAAIFRVRHCDCAANGIQSMTNIWMEWEGLQPLPAGGQPA